MYRKEEVNLSLTDFLAFVNSKLQPPWSQREVVDQLKLDGGRRWKIKATSEEIDQTRRGSTRIELVDRRRGEIAVMAKEAKA